jgi:hypothetical protein
MLFFSFKAVKRSLSNSQKAGEVPLMLQLILAQIMVQSYDLELRLRNYQNRNFKYEQGSSHMLPRFHPVSPSREFPLYVQNML